MTKKEFNKVINKVCLFVESPNGHIGLGKYTCDLLGNLTSEDGWVHSPTRDLYVDLFKDDNDRSYEWLTDMVEEKEGTYIGDSERGSQLTDIRLSMLGLFKEYVISEGLYEEL